MKIKKKNVFSVYFWFFVENVQNCHIFAPLCMSLSQNTEAELSIRELLRKTFYNHFFHETLCHAHSVHGTCWMMLATSGQNCYFVHWRYALIFNKLVDMLSFDSLIVPVENNNLWAGINHSFRISVVLFVLINLMHDSNRKCCFQ